MNSIKIQIMMFFVIISILSSLLVCLPSLIEQKKLASAMCGNELNNSASLIRMSIENELQDAIHAVAQFTENPDVKSMRKDRIQEMSSYFVEYVNLFYNLYVYDRKGNLMSVTYYGRENEKDLSHHMQNFNEKQNEFTETANTVLRDGKARFTPAFWRRDELFIAYVVPIFAGKSKEAAGIASFGILVNNTKMKGMLKALVPSYSGFICLVDGVGHVFGKEGSLPYSISSLPIQRLQDDLKLKEPVIMLNGNAYNYTLKRIENTELFVMVGMSNKAINNSSTGVMTTIVLLNILFLILAVTMSMMLGHHMAHNLRELSRGLREIGKGHYSHRITSRAHGELGDAIESFNKTAEKLQQQEEKKPAPG